MEKKKSKLSKLLKEQARTRRIVFVLACIVGVCIAFAAGFFFRSQINLMNSLGIPVGEESSLNILGVTSSDDTKSKSLKTVYNSVSARIGEIEDLLDTSSLSSSDVDAATVTAINDILASTGDQYAKYFSASEYSDLVTQSRTNKYAGIGATLNEMNGRCYIADVFDGSEAQAKGLLTGDYIKSINGESQIGKTATEVRNKIAGLKDSSAVFNIVRPLAEYGETGTEFSVSLHVSDMDVENVSSEVVGDFGYINVHQFNDETSDLFKKAIDEFEKQELKGYVIDIRNNPGGYMSGALSAASSFVASGTLVSIETSSGTTARTTEGQTITERPIVVLINSSTSAACEVFAAALHDNNRATLIGQRTAGKGTVATTRELSFGGAIRFSAARYITPDGNPIEGNGVNPDIEIANISDLSIDDEALENAIDSAFL